MAEDVVNELSTALLSRAAKRGAGNAAQNAYDAGQDGKRKGAGKLDKAQRRVKMVRKCVDKIASRCESEVLESQVELVKSIILDKELVA